MSTSEVRDQRSLEEENIMASKIRIAHEIVISRVQSLDEGVSQQRFIEVSGQINRFIPLPKADAPFRYRMEGVNSESSVSWKEDIVRGFYRGVGRRVGRWSW